MATIVYLAHTIQHSTLTVCNALDQVDKMDRELDNANPTIFAPTASGSKRQISPKALLWSGDEEGFTLSDEAGSSDEEREDIDAEEVFGMSAPTQHHGLAPMIRPLPLSYR